MSDHHLDETESDVLRDGEGFIEDFDTWLSLLALEDVLDEALGEPEIAAGLHREGLRADDARNAVLGSATALARIRMERERAGVVFDRPRRLPLRQMTLREAGWLAVTCALLVGYLRILQLSWQAMPLGFQLLGVLGLGAVIGMAVLVISRRIPGLFVTEGRERGTDRAHPEMIGLGDRWEFVLHEIVLPELRDHIRDHRRIRDRVNLVFEDPDASAELEAGLVRTAAVKRLRRIVDRAESVAVALAGHRGTGKTTSIRSLEQGLLSRSDQAAPLVVVASAPAAYEARDFVLHLHALLCKAVLAKISKGSRAVPGRLRRRAAFGRLLRTSLAFLVFWGVVAVAVRLLWGGTAAQDLGTLAVEVVNGRVTLQQLWTGQPTARLIALGLVSMFLLRLVIGVLAAGVTVTRLLIARRRDVRLAGFRRVTEQQLDRIRFLQTYTTGWSGKLSMPLKGEAGRTWSTQRAEQQLTHPEVVDKFREFAELAAVNLAGRVVIAIDELDKIGEPDKAHQFINDVKGVFDVPGCLFFVSVSDDAVLGFEQRGLGVRDAFDSAFSEMVRLEPFTLDESRLWIALRLRGVSEQFCYLAHCLSGGLPRDLKRCAVEMADLASEIYQPSLEVVARSLVAGELTGKTRAFTATAATLERSPELVALTTDLLGIPGTDAPEELAEIAGRLVRTEEDTAAPISDLRWHSGCFVLFCATVLEVFDDTLTGDRLSPGLHRLAVVRQRMAMHPRQAWDDLVEFRKGRGSGE
ncbi:P-loop NTPase fold protein [Amycolatopsis sp. BJA-103]|uniref:P-loop NTPase fold protein n=1 Tax=Amycolatopsis sp. BJA-103 TaxID=1911175 RepID=UPI000C761DDE|nr:P-loop NTPase fold protein [Amycolatopsis sp. BJA-103]AUI58738.1 hypothetical protein BKN51_11310 [Amycolatopsis sp. BJA-103]PNE16759.1 hypothetical protein B1H26_23260 [Amycolatopsis sp. BJA-103]